MPPSKPGMLALIQRGATIRGITEGDADPHDFIPRMIALHASGRFPIEKLITRYRLSDINQAVQDHVAGRCVKAVLLP